MNIDSLTSFLTNISCTFIDASAGARHLVHGCVATLEKRENCLRVAPCREPNDKLSLAAFERFTTLDQIDITIQLMTKLPPAAIEFITANMRQAHMAISIKTRACMQNPCIVKHECLTTL